MIRNRSVNEPHSTRGRPRSRSAHEAILASTFAEIRDRGYEAASIEGIASRAGVAKTTLYRHWESKESLVVEAVDRLVRAVPFPDTGSTRDDLHQIMDFTGRVYRDPATAPLLASLLAAMTRSPAIATAVRRGFVASRQRALRTILLRGVTRGELRAGADVDLAVDMLGGTPLYRTLVRGAPVTERGLKRLADVVLRGLAP